jgi:hypothetical protein
MSVAQVVSEMTDWLATMGFGDVDEWDCTEIYGTVNRYYTGGCAEFASTCGYVGRFISV